MMATSVPIGGPSTDISAKMPAVCWDTCDGFDSLETMVTPKGVRGGEISSPSCLIYLLLMNKRIRIENIRQ